MAVYSHVILQVGHTMLGRLCNIQEHPAEKVRGLKSAHASAAMVYALWPCYAHPKERGCSSNCHKGSLGSSCVFLVVLPCIFISFISFFNSYFILKYFHCLLLFALLQVRVCVTNSCLNTVIR